MLLTLLTVLTTICLGGLVAAFINQSKVNKLVNENIKVNKSNLSFRVEFIEMGKKVENLTNVSMELNQTNNLLMKTNKKIMAKYEEILLTNTDLISRVEHLEDENKKITRVLENYNMMAPAFKISQPFSMKMVK